MVHIRGGVIFDLTCATGTPLLCKDDNYKYLSILECDMILLKDFKEDVRKEYLTRINVILKAYASYKNTITSISAYAMSVLWYGFGILH